MANQFEVFINYIYSLWYYSPIKHATRNSQYVNIYYNSKRKQIKNPLSYSSTKEDLSHTI